MRKRLIYVLTGLGEWVILFSLGTFASVATCLFRAAAETQAIWALYINQSA
jgi:hypothetical protein